MATNTPNYDFDREDPGADGWTDRMNGNFTDLDTLFSTGVVNGTPIQQVGTSNTSTSVFAESTKPTTANGVSQSVHAALQEGYVVAVSNMDTANNVVLDPLDYANDAVGWQAAIDEILSRGGPTAELHVPHTASDGNPFVLTEQVIAGSTTDEAVVSIYGHYGGRRQDPATPQRGIECDTGTTPAILQQSGTYPGRGADFEGLYFDCVGNNTSIYERKDCSDGFIRFRAANFGGTGMTCSGTANDSYEYMLTPNNAPAIGVDWQDNATGIGQAGNSDHGIAPTSHIQGNHDISMRSTSSSSGGRITVNGHYEGAQTASLQFIGEGRWNIAPGTNNLLTSGGTSSAKCIELDCYDAVVAPSRIAGSTGYGIYGTCRDSLHISPSIMWGQFGGNFGNTRINITALPNETHIGPPGTIIPSSDVSYPTGFNLYSTTTA